MGKSSQLIHRYSLILLKEISTSGKSWIRSQKQNTFLAFGFAGPVALFPLLYSYQAFYSLDPSLAAIINLTFAILLSASTSIFNNSSTRLCHSSILNSLPISKPQLFVTHCLFVVFSNLLFLICILMSLTIGLFLFDDIGSFLIVVWRFSIYAVTMCWASYFISYFRLSFSYSIVLLFIVGYATIICSALVLPLVITIGAIATAAIPEIKHIRLLKRPSILSSIVIKSSFAIFSLGFFISLVAIFLADAISQITLTIFSACLVVLMCQTISWAVTFYRDNCYFLTHLPFGKQVLKSTVGKFIALNITVQLGFFVSTYILLSDSTSLLIFQLLSMFIGSIFAIFKDELRLAAQLSILLIYLMAIN